MKKNKTIPFLIYPIIGILVFIFFIIFFEFFLNYLIGISSLKTFDLKKIMDNSFLTSLENNARDLLMRFRSSITDTFYSTTYTKRTLSKNVSKDIMIVGIDEKSLNNIGRWPFKRYEHSKLLDYFTNSKYRENSLFFDIFFVEPDTNNPEYDVIFIESIKKNNNVVFDYIARDDPYETDDEKKEMDQRYQYLVNKFGNITKISGTVNELNTFLGVTPPLIPYLDVIQNCGYANLVVDIDKIVRKYPLLSKYKVKEETRFSELQENQYADVIYNISYIIDYDNKNNYYKLLKIEPRVYEQDKIPFQNRKKLSKNDLDTIKAKIDKNNLDFQLEIDKFKTRLNKIYDNLSLEIINYLKSSLMPEEFKKEIKEVFLDKENRKNFDELLYELVTNFENLEKEDKKFSKDKNFFIKMYKKCPKIDKIGETKNNRTISLYNILYEQNKNYFEDLIIHQEKIIISAPLMLICRYFNINNPDQIEVILGKEIKLLNPLVKNPDTNNLESPIIKGKQYKEIKIPIDKKGFMDINFAGKPSTTNRTNKTTFDAYSYSDFSQGKISTLVRNKLVLIGAFSSGMVEDTYQTPFQTMFGIEIIANTVNTAITNDFIIKLPDFLYTLILLFISIIISIISSNKNIIKAYIFTIIFIFLYFIFASYLFTNFNILLEIPKVIIISIFSLMSVIVYRILTEEKQKKQIKSIFSKYVNPSVVEQLLKHPPELGGVDMDITVQFSDIRGFTTLSESLTPQELVSILNKYLTAMTDIIMQYDGTLDKYIGDAIMCFWGAPNPIENHAELACMAALKQIEKLKEINDELPEGKKINIGIGLNSGIMTAGNMGSTGRMNYTIMGDNVNLGSRLEGLNKYYGTQIIVSEFTYEKAKHKFFFRELDNIKVKGKLKPVKIYELLCTNEELKNIDI